MKISLTLLLSLPVALRAAAIGSAPRSVDDGIVAYSIKRRQYAEDTRRLGRHSRRSSTVLSSLSLNDKWIFSGGYFMDVEVGTPPQRLEVLLDTGSSDLFVPSSAAPKCLEHHCPGGSFNEHASKTFKRLAESADFHTQFLDGSTANGSYAQDTVHIGEAALKNHVFAIADEIQVSPFHEGGTGPQYGIVGLSFTGQEASVCASAPKDCNVNFTTPTIIDSLYSAGQIRSRSFSLYLDDVESGSGSILFGGIDKAKYHGDLMALSVLKDKHQWTEDMYVSQSLSLTSISGTVNETTTHYTPSHYESTVIIDSGAGFLSLPPFVYDQIVASAPVALQYDGSSAMLCKHAKLDASLTLGLTGANKASANITIPFSSLVVPVYEGPYDNSRPYLHDGEELCVFAVTRGTETDNVLGDPLLRSAYAVFNLDDKTISLAQANYDSTTSNTHAIGSSRGPKTMVQKPVPHG